MTKKKTGEVVALPKREEEPRELTPEEIAEIMRQDEEELDSHLSKFKKIKQPDASLVNEEEDEDEETITLDFSEDGQVKAYEKLGEGVVARNEEGDIYEVDEATAKRVKELVEEEAPKKPEKLLRYENMIRDRFVSKAIGALMTQLNDAGNGLDEAIGKNLGRTGVGGALNEEAYTMISNRKDELRKAWSWSGEVQYQAIPDWALDYIDDYVRDAINALLDFVERD